MRASQSGSTMRATPRLVHIVPAVRPSVDGLGDYCKMVWQHWPDPRPEWHCLVGKLPDGAQAAWPEVHISGFDRSYDGMLAGLRGIDATHLVLHYVGYGYQKKGCPLWLPSALGAWREQTGGRIVAVLHELYATGKPWQTAFWTWGVQRGLMHRLVNVADRWVVSCSDYYETVVRQLPDARPRGALIPIGTNISRASEVDIARPWPLCSGEQLKIVVFGLPRTRLVSLRTHQALLKRLVERGNVHTISLLGKSDDGRWQAETEALMTLIAPRSAWRTAWDLPSGELSAELTQHDLGLLPNRTGIISKSGVYAAFCAHGLAVLAPGRFSDAATCPFPCLINDRDDLEASAAQLSDFSVMAAHRARVREADATLLSWTSITEQLRDRIIC